MRAAVVGEPADYQGTRLGQGIYWQPLARAAFSYTEPALVRQRGHDIAAVVPSTQFDQGFPGRGPTGRGSLGGAVQAAAAQAWPSISARPRKAASAWSKPSPRPQDGQRDEVIPAAHSHTIDWMAQTRDYREARAGVIRPSPMPNRIVSARRRP